MKKAKAFAAKITAVLLCAVLIWGSAFTAAAAVNPSKTMTVDSTVSLALANDRQLKKMNNQIILKKAQYMQAVASVSAKWDDYNSFRWSPLLSFKFPEKPYMTDEFELSMKAYLANSELKLLKRQIKDRQIQITAKVQILFSEIYVLQEKLTYEQNIYTAAKADYARNKARASAGIGKQEDILTLEKNINSAESQIAVLSRDLQNRKDKLSEQIGISVSTDYSFKNPLAKINIPRADLPAIIKHTLDNDLTVYEARAELTIAQENLNQYQRLYGNRYGWIINIIMGDIQAAENGQKVDYDGFKQRYDYMLWQMESYWSGTKKILFFRFPKVWFKGKLDGSRYIDDEKYALYVSTMEYDDALRGKEITEKEITSSVKDNFEALITVENAYYNSVESSKKENQKLQKIRELNKIGRAEFSEVTDQQESCQSSQMETIDFLAAYSNQIAEFDRLTCGAVTKLKQTGEITGDEGQGADSYAHMQAEDKPYYYTDMMITDLQFLFGVIVPEQYETPISDFELWYENQQIGARTPVGGQIIHMPIVYKDTNKMTVRLYYDNKFVDEADIDATTPRDILKLKKIQKQITQAAKAIGSFTAQKDPQTGKTTIAFEMFPYESISKYLVIDENGKSIYHTQPVLISEKFIYLDFALANLSKLKVNFYDKDDVILYTAAFDTSTGRMLSIPQNPK